MPFPELFILRHGETLWNRQHRLQGRLDSPLTDKGRAQAARQGDILAEVLGGRDGDELDWIRSPLGRSRTTSEIVAPDRPWREDARLREISMGQWEGQTAEEIRASAPHLFESDDGFALFDHAPGGEHIVGLDVRLRGFLIDLTGPAVLVTHGITSRVLRCLLLGLPAEAFDTLSGGQGVVYHLREGTSTLLR